MNEFFEQKNTGFVLALAPMAGVTDMAFRSLCCEMADIITTTEMISSRGLCYGDAKTAKLLLLGGAEKAAGVQIFGSDPGCMAQAAVIAAEKSGAKFIDINMGCPTPKIVKSGDGCALMGNPELASRIIRAVADASPVPVSVKFRKGIDKGKVNAVDFAKMAESSGASRICVHGRTMTQMYSGQADWDIIRAVVKAVSIPVMANGDIFSARDAVRVLNYTGADAAMIGRAAFGNPWIFRCADMALRGLEPPEGPSLSQRLEMALRQYELTIPYKGEHIASLEARKFFSWYVRGLPHMQRHKNAMHKMTAREDVLSLVREVMQSCAMS